MRYPSAAAHNEALGPVRSRGSANGLVIHGGRIAAAWGDTSRVDMALSVSKSYLSIVAGLAVGAGLIASVDHPVSETISSDLVDANRNHDVTWRQLLQQTGEWRGTLWGKPWFADQADRRVRRAPSGTRWAYSDVRTNLLALALLEVWRRPLPDVLRERVMQPIGASRAWRGTASTTRSS
jgi:CubicO group peptidase (beta-lactamase class C family)